MPAESPITEQLWNHLFDATFEVARQDAQLRDQNLALVAAIGELVAVLNETLQTLRAVVPSVRPECAPAVLELLGDFGRRGQAIAARLRIASSRLSTLNSQLSTLNSQLSTPLAPSP